MSKFLKQLKHYSDKQFFLIAGPCVVESESLCIQIVEELLSITDKLKIPYIFKASFRKANRTKGDSFRGLGDDIALQILDKIRNNFHVPVLTDIHESHEVDLISEYVDILQIPAFLCRQTSLLEAAGKTGKPINIKKGQFVGPDQMSFAAQKIQQAGNSDVWLTERGSFFGYHDLVVDFRSVLEMKKSGFPVIYDATHSLQKPNTGHGVSGGIPEYISPMAKAAVALGVDGLFIETHPDPSKALSDGANMLPLNQVESLMRKLQEISQVL
ncbi:MAG: 3-deoxy-8-phosphooctulonate synthase [Bacteroidetes bacterium]|jgi:2-dehydro-3-deoxyphosphooctonate aldolase (KDO 8-P synthase)|nr:3-deoxy-8-phosphooctulonate synthase [Bacteroidota bacterium]MBT3749218.1 3-deoxy-8-phosphooctulonate synthase [Bacteroidota bacterium]MBT4399127.1 3-deoxy-8-phosphooctulonate synthase [Bacteroidota bacterium]MBT4410624.1 3-deoxy-8-phosphooctulonate synthase [Bacteroidota bacterium]MBT5428015.1 3-deoxy-8-phosphooctulonate synthase [Bacteroidota bacterium]